MKKVHICFLMFVLFILAFVLSACGSTAAKIYGVGANIELPEDYGQYGIADTPLADKTTLAENDFVLEVGKAYNLSIDYIAGGGSQYPVRFAENFVLKYDKDIFDISPVFEENCLGDQKPLMYYSLICKQKTTYATIIIEANGQYTCNVIISAN